MPRPDPNDFTGKYNTALTPDQQAAFNHWALTQKQQTGKDPRRDMYDYDVQGDWLAGASRDARGHGSDQFKKPNHPTFSNQSQWHGIDGYVGGNWADPTSTSPGTYQASQTNLAFHSPESLQEYFNKIEPDTTLLMPTPAPTPTGAHGNYSVADLGGKPAAPAAQPPASWARYNPARLN